MEPLAEPLPLVPVWNGILHEFRNHLTVLLAAATEVRSGIPPEVAIGIADALAETEWNVQRLNALIAFVDAALRDGALLVADLDDVVERALKLAAPTLGRVAVSFTKQRRLGVGNRGSALEALLAALLLDLARCEGKPPADQLRVQSDSPRMQIDVRAEIARGIVLLEIESSGGRPPADSWRFALASDLGARIGATVAANPDRPGYVVRLA